MLLVSDSSVPFEFFVGASCWYRSPGETPDPLFESVGSVVEATLETVFESAGSGVEATLDPVFESLGSDVTPPSCPPVSW